MSNNSPLCNALLNVLSMPKFTPMGDMAVMQLKDDVMAKASLKESSTIDRFDVLNIEIINCHTGRLDQQSFPLAELEKRPNNHPNAAQAPRLYLWRRVSEVQWYINEPAPKAMGNLRAQVEDYLGFFSNGRL